MISVFANQAKHAFIACLCLTGGHQPVDNDIAMRTCSTQPGSSTALVVLAVVLSMGTSANVSTGSIPATARTEMAARTVSDRSAAGPMAQFLSCLTDAARQLTGVKGSPHQAVAITGLNHGLQAAVQLLPQLGLAISDGGALPPAAPLRRHLTDLPPPNAML